MSVARQALVLCSCLLVAATARAEQPLMPQTPDAKAHYETGLRKYNLLKWDEAIAEFEAGYEIEPAPYILYSLAQSYRLHGNCEKAIGMYRGFLRAQLPPKVAETARDRLKKCEGIVRDKTPAVVAPIAPVAPVVPVTPPPAVNLAPPPTTHVDLTQRAPAHKPIYKRWWFWTVTGVVVVGVAVGVGLGLGLQQQKAPSSTLGTMGAF